MLVCKVEGYQLSADWYWHLTDHFWGGYFVYPVIPAGFAK
jgi:hypothetical protein